MVTSGFDQNRASVDAARAAQTVVADFADGISSIAAAVTGQGPGDVQAARVTSATKLRSEIALIAVLAEDALRAVASQKEAADKSGSAKVMSVIASIVIVVVAVVLAVLTFGAGGALVALAVIAASAIIGAAVAAAGKATGAAQSFALDLCAALQRVQAILRTLQLATDTERARAQAISDLGAVLRGIAQAAPAIGRVTSACGADLQVMRVSCDRVDQSLASLVAYMRRLGLSISSEGQALADAIERIRRAFVESAGALTK